MSETCTVELTEDRRIRHGLSNELTLMGSRDTSILRREYDIFVELHGKYPDSQRFPVPLSEFYYTMYDPQSLYDACFKNLTQWKDIVPKCTCMADLDSYIDSEQILPHRQIWEYIIQIGRGMRDLHRADIIHRDLSIHTVTVGKDGAMLSNLISAAVYDDNGMNPPLPPVFAGIIYPNSHYQIVNSSSSISPYWTAPEVLTDPSNFSPAADMWSFGILMYRAIGGDCPIRSLKMLNEFGTVDLDRVIAFFNLDFTFPNPEFGINYIPELMTLIHECLKSNPDDRPTFDDSFVERLVTMGDLVEQKEKEHMRQGLKNILQSRKLVQSYTPTQPTDPEICQIQ